MRKIVLVVILVAVLIAANVRQTQAKPLLNRIKRVSDQRLAELETLIALDRLKGKLITVPVGIGLPSDPRIIGRKRRTDESILQNLFNASEEDISDQAAILDAEEAELEAKEDTLLQRLQSLQHLQHLQQLRRRAGDPPRRLQPPQ
ncbi:uncharacterized protein [Atheta coriaria]|uniref:uncharacterized protein n=1 Tax=Dalotia coriaria TaxID=877792 RepID=UPI0031F3F08F